MKARSDRTTTTSCPDADRRLQLIGSLGLSAGLTLTLLLSSSTAETRLGVPQYWPWLLTGLQVLALWAAGAQHRSGWLLGAAAQPPWIAYAILSGQLGFIPGCAVSAVVQVHAFLRNAAPPAVRQSETQAGRAMLRFSPVGFRAREPR